MADKNKNNESKSQRTEAAVLKLIYELEVQKIELKNQNEELEHALGLLKESEEKYRLLHENAGIGIGYYNPDGTIISYNQLAAKNMNGVPEQFNGKSIFDIFPRPDAEFYYNRILKALIADQSDVYEDMVLLPSGNKYFMSTFTKIEGLNNQIMGVQVISQEITERWKAEDNLRESEKKFRLLFKNMTSGFALHEIILNAEGKPCDYRFLDINPAFEKLTGLKSINLIGKTTLEVLPNTEPYWIETYGQVALTGKAINFENYSIELGKHYHVHAYSTEHGKFVTIFLDITERKQAEEEQRDYQDRLSSILNTVGDPIFVKDNEHRIILANQAFYDIFALDENATLGKTLVEHVTEDEREQFLEVDRRVLDTGISDMREESLSVSSRSKRVIVTKKTRFVDVSGNRFLVGSIHDITERKQNEERVLLTNSTIKREQLEKEVLINSTTDLIWSVDREFRLITANEAFLKDTKALTGWTFKHGDNLLDENLYSSELIAFWKELYENVIEGQTIKREFYTPETDHTDYSWLEINLNPIYVGTQIIGVACFGRTITDRKDAEEEIRKSNEIREQLLAHMTEIRENERALISREIHDQLGQSLTALKLDINWLQAKMSKTPEIKEKLSGMVNIVTSTIKDVQRISSELRPGILDDLGLTAAIEWYAEEFEKRSNLIVKLDLDEVQASNEQANLALFRVMQESLTNIIRHAKAKSVQISLHEINEHIVLDIEDDGIGMSVEKLNSIHALGLWGMHDRIKQVGGTIDILCGSDAGTKLRICIPIEDTILKKNRK